MTMTLACFKGHRALEEVSPLAAGRLADIYLARNLDSGAWVEIHTTPLSGMDEHPCQNSMLNATEPKTWLDVCSRNSRER